MTDLRTEGLKTIRLVFPDVFAPQIDPDQLWLVRKGKHHIHKIPTNLENYAMEAITQFTYKILKADKQGVA